MENVVQSEWQASNSLSSLKGFPEAVEAEVARLIEWYGRKNKWKKKCSIFYRGATIFCSTLGLLIPVLAPLIPEGRRANAYHWGYVFALLAVFFITIDRQFSFTSSWVRTLKAARQLETALWEFRANWFRLGISTPRPSDETFAGCVKDFLLKARSIVDQEADTWATETLASLNQLEKAASTGAEEARKRYEAVVDTMRSGAIEVTLTNLPQAEWWCSVSLNGQIRKRTWRSPVCGIVDVLPGNVEVLVEAETATGDKLIGAKTVTVVSGAPIAVPLPLYPIA